MTKYDEIISKLATVIEQNKTQNLFMDRLDKKLTQHERDSEPFRRMCSNNKTKITLVFSVLGIVGSILGIARFF